MKSPASCSRREKKSAPPTRRPRLTSHLRPVCRLHHLPQRASATADAFCLCLFGPQQSGALPFLLAPYPLQSIACVSRSRLAPASPRRFSPPCSACSSPHRCARAASRPPRPQAQDSWPRHQSLRHAAERRHSQPLRRRRRDFELQLSRLSHRRLLRPGASGRIHDRLPRARYARRQNRRLHQRR